MLRIDHFIREFSSTFVEQKEMMPWEVTTGLQEILNMLLPRLDSAYKIDGGVAIHHSSIVERGVTLKAPIIINENCFLGANAYLRGGVFLGKKVIVGPGCEIKSSIIHSESSLGHFNFIGDSIVGSHVNFEAGSLTANYHNERSNKMISVRFNSATIETNVEKFGALVGDNSRIGANAVLSPGTLLYSGTIVKRLQLVDQMNTPT
jgi:UDP-N-acetylglucosamine diphosphorylase / glucose-1-phosphate thymidylyltransferase / UDP-N-acetylgalactosamine diphosphorylase / glucosamine-1-phosphate N-acetyltransferase / galactosamine-1-phosphate N-acetyltransferase